MPQSKNRGYKRVHKIPFTQDCFLMLIRRLALKIAPNPPVACKKRSAACNSGQLRKKEQNCNRLCLGNLVGCNREGIPRPPEHSPGTTNHEKVGRERNRRKRRRRVRRKRRKRERERRKETKKRVENED